MSLTGTWTWSWTGPQGDAHRHVLEIVGTGQSRTVRERYDDDEPVKVNDLKVVGKKVEFSVTRGNRRSAYTGTLADADSITGKVLVAVDNQNNEFTWTATRMPVKK